ncbi:MAG: hypothetical protein IPG53_02415 [Ignavibacteriales bacterium]|nr:hypothetical protein [Ignavibacteriales bacterium]
MAQRCRRIIPEITPQRVIRLGEVCIGTAGGGETVYMIDGATGEMIWEFGDPINYDQGDVNGIDGKKDWNKKR